MYVSIVTLYSLGFEIINTFILERLFFVCFGRNDRCNIKTPF